MQSSGVRIGLTLLEIERIPVRTKPLHIIPEGLREDVYKRQGIKFKEERQIGCGIAPHNISKIRLQACQRIYIPYRKIYRRFFC